MAKSNSSLRVLGIMTGTSCDGLDASCLEFETTRHGERWRSLWSASVPYDPKLRARVLALQKQHSRFELEEILKLHRDLGHWYAKSISVLLKKRSLPDLIALHGQTIAHFPESGTTWQLGDPSLVASRTGITVACQFREGDMAAGGQGAPLLPLFHARIAEEQLGRRNGVSFLNLGGIGNLTYLGPNDSLFAFDTGPGNFWIDECVETVTGGRYKFDAGGKLARAGHVDWGAVEEVMRHPYFRKKAPKSTGRGDFPRSLLTRSTRKRGVDLIATATAIIVESVARAYEDFLRSHRRFPLTHIYVCGGGAQNPTLIAWLQARMSPIAVADIARIGLHPQSIESQGFAYFGYLAARGQALGGTWTGAKEFGPPAHFVPGSNWNRFVSRVSKFF